MYTTTRFPLVVGWSSIITLCSTTQGVNVYPPLLVSQISYKVLQSVAGTIPIECGVSGEDKSTGHFQVRLLVSARTRTDARLTLWLCDLDFAAAILNLLKNK